MSKTETNEGVAILLNEKVTNALANNSKPLFERAFAMSSAIVQVKELLTPAVMKPIMALQGNKLGFRTDKDTTGGYPEEVVKNCVIEAVLSGFEVVGNQFNIIGGNMYGTKEGFGAQLKKMQGLSYEITPELPRVNEKKDGAAVTMNIHWTIEGKSFKRKIDFAVKMNQYAGVDAAIGKATRKARAWLYNTITGTEIGEGDTEDIPHTVVETNKPSKEQKEEERLLGLIAESGDIATLEAYHKECKTDVTQAAYNLKRIKLTPAKKEAPVVAPVETAEAVGIPTAGSVEEDSIFKNIRLSTTITHLEQILPHLQDKHQQAYREKKMEIGKKLQA